MTRKLLADVRVAIACMFFGLGLQLVGLAGQLDQYLWPGGFGSVGVICGLGTGMIIGLLIPITLGRGGGGQWARQIQINRSMGPGSAGMSVLACELLTVAMVVAAMVAALQCAGLAYLGRSIQAVPDKILLAPAEWIALVFGSSGLVSLPSGVIAGVSGAIAFYLLLARAGRKVGRAGYFQAVLANMTVWMAGSLGAGCVAANALVAVGLVNSHVILLGCISQLFAALWATAYTARDVSGKSPGARKDEPMPLKIIRRPDGPEFATSGGVIVSLVLIVSGWLLGWWGQLWWRVIKDWASATDGLLVDGYEKMVLGAMAVGWLCGLCLGQPTWAVNRGPKGFVGKRLLLAGAINAGAVLIYSSIVVQAWQISGRTAVGVLSLAVVAAMGLVAMLLGWTYQPAAGYLARGELRRTGLLCRVLSLKLGGIVLGLAGAKLFGSYIPGGVAGLGSGSLAALAMGGLAMIYDEPASWAARSGFMKNPRHRRIVTVGSMYLTLLLIVLLVGLASRNWKLSTGGQAGWIKRGLWCTGFVVNNGGQRFMTCDGKRVSQVEYNRLRGALPDVLSQIAQAVGPVKSVLLLNLPWMESSLLGEKFPAARYRQVHLADVARRAEWQLIQGGDSAESGGGVKGWAGGGGDLGDLIDLRLEFRNYQLVIFDPGHRLIDRAVKLLAGRAAARGQGVRMIMLRPENFADESSGRSRYLGTDWLEEFGAGHWRGYVPVVTGTNNGQ